MRGRDVISQPRQIHISVKMEEYINEWYNEVAERLIKKLDEYFKNVSGWIVEATEKVCLVITPH